MGSQRPDAFSPGAPLAPEAPTSIVETQRIGGTSWQQNKLIEDERRLDAIAKRAANKQMAHAEANPTMFKRGYLDDNGMFVAYEDNAPGHETRREAPAPHHIDPLLDQMEKRSPNFEHDAAYVPQLMTEAERARRDAALRAEEAACPHSEYSEVIRGMTLVRICNGCGMEATFSPEGVSYRQTR